MLNSTENEIFLLISVKVPIDYCMYEYNPRQVVHLAVAGDVFDGVFLCCHFSLEMFWMRSGA